ncbi:NAD(P)-dependent dehydrogenase (short-subunit alcohol dehydrogenase family) [Pseudonocardia eucalypti]|nr:NAD(P)-dependent dehydrogenase (short-subunit alcohol dehydrogenase family) [Pseudonocardia eucalypti]
MDETTMTSAPARPATWFITGASRGFGRLWSEAALERGDRVAATARDISTLAPLVDRFGESVLPVALDVTDRAGAVAAVRDTARRFGSLDVVVNNAGYGHFGAVEELTEAELRDQLETNFFGAVWVTQAALPIMRAQGSGHILQVTSEGGVRAFPGIGAYHASKWALEGLSDSLAQETAAFGIHITCVEPGPYRTGWLDVGARQSAALPAYARLRDTPMTFDTGDPEATKAAILRVVDADPPPRRVFFGKCLDNVRRDYTDRLAEWDRWQPLALAAFGDT